MGLKGEGRAFPACDVIWQCLRQVVPIFTTLRVFVKDHERALSIDFEGNTF